MKWTTPDPALNYYDGLTNEPYFPIIDPEGLEVEISGEKGTIQKTIAKVYGDDCKQVAAEIVKRYEAHEKLLRKLDLAADALAKIRPNSIIADSARLLLKELEGA